MNFVKYLLGASMIINLYYLYTYSTLITLNSLKYVIPETENDYPMLTKQNLRGMSQEVRNMVKTDIINALIDEQWNSIYRGVILATGQENVSSYVASLNCYQYLYKCYSYCDHTTVSKINTNKALCQSIGSILPTTNKEIFLKYLIKFSSGFVESTIQTLDSSEIGLRQNQGRGGEYFSVPHIYYENSLQTFYVPNRDLQYDEPTLTNINLAKRRIIQFKFNSTEIEDILESEIERKIIETFPDVNITKTYSECCQKFILKW